MSFPISLPVSRHHNPTRLEPAELRTVDVLVSHGESSGSTDKLLKWSIIIGIFLISMALFYYLAVFIPSREQVKVDLEIAKFQANHETVLRNQLLLAACLNQAETQWLSVASLYENMYQEQRDAGATQVSAYQHISQAVEKNETQLQQNKENCFKQFPQAPAQTSQ